MIGFALALAFYILREHYAHALGMLPYLIILACPLLHLFGHDRHGEHRHVAGTHSHAAPDDEGARR